MQYHFSCYSFVELYAVLQIIVLKNLFKTEDQIMMEEIQNNILSEITRSKNLTDIFINSDELQKIILP